MNRLVISQCYQLRAIDAPGTQSDSSVRTALLLNTSQGSGGKITLDGEEFSCLATLRLIALHNAECVAGSVTHHGLRRTSGRVSLVPSSGRRLSYRWRYFPRSSGHVQLGR